MLPNNPFQHHGYFTVEHTLL